MLHVMARLVLAFVFFLFWFSGAVMLHYLIHPDIEGWKQKTYTCVSGDHIWNRKKYMCDKAEWLEHGTDK